MSMSTAVRVRRGRGWRMDLCIKLVVVVILHLAAAGWKDWLNCPTEQKE